MPRQEDKFYALAREKAKKLEDQATSVERLKQMRERLQTGGGLSKK